MTDKLHIDIETFSSVDIKKSGAYKYCEAPDFEIMLFAWAFNDEPVVVTDLIQGETLPKRVTDAIANKKIIKCAHNATFERTALRAVGYDTPVSVWECSMVKAAYCGLPLSLDKISDALELGDKSKLSGGKALIKYFCNPRKPTKSNPNARIFPSDDPEKWQAFISYCHNDVVAERAVVEHLEPYELPDQEQEMYIVDQMINDRGIRIDTQMAQSAIEMDNKASGKILNKMADITNLENPNSTKQLKEWLSDAMKKDITSLAKAEIPKLLEETDSGAVRSVLKLRIKAAKTSTRKYTAMMNCLCDDGRAHGLFQFYGANRTGRWAGRLIQLQNLPQNHIANLQLARDIVKSGDIDLLGLLYDNIPSVLSQLIRTAFVANDGHTFAVADFSSIEARVIAWLADEQWRLEVFRTHGKIYEASASMMFGVPIEEIIKGSDLRSKGKVAELALGFGGSIGALKRMSGDAYLSESDMVSIVKIWRNTNQSIVKMWYEIDKHAKAALKTGRKIVCPYKNIVFDYDGLVLTITLPSGRKLFYYQPSFGVNRFGKESLCYKGMDQVTKHWTNVDTYGGKLVENIVQAIARDLLAQAMLKLNKQDFKIVMHVHDEVVCEVPEENSAHSLLKVCVVMSENVDWAKGLPLGADGYLTPFYKKD